MSGNHPVRLDDAFLLRALDGLEECLEAPLSGRAQAWAERVSWSLAETDSALQQHIDAAEAHAGPFTAEDLKGPMMPTADQRVHQLEQHHQVLRGATRSLRQDLAVLAQPFADGPQINDLLKIRRRARQLISDIQRHKENETILLMENVNMDIGVGD
jgi:hypothetical protein